MKCPRCETTYHKSVFGHNVWYDCLKCNMKKEDIEKEEHNAQLKSFGGVEYVASDLDIDWDNMLVKDYVDLMCKQKTSLYMKPNGNIYTLNDKGEEELIYGQEIV